MSVRLPPLAFSSSDKENLMASKLDQGEVTISLDGEDLVLKPTVRAAMAVNNLFDGFANANAALGRANMISAIAVIRIGANLSEKDARDLDERVYAEMGRESGAWASLLVGLIRYVAILQNGGKPLPDDVERAIVEPQAAAGN